ncbi:MAG: hypothetical protein KatS3mg008_0952 [Acidimicrobiales bacterium]|nr:MAG: hypothetical protein KatS3mg008_0952 [Acidimicrobiales bacterium]
MVGWFRSLGISDAEDLTQEVFLQVVRDLHRFQGDEDALRRWLYTVAWHRMIDHRRRLRRHERALERARFVGEAASTDAVSAAADDSQKWSADPDLLRALGLLSRPQREVLTLRFVADLSIEEVARITGRTKTSVKALQRRGMARLRKILEWGVPPPARGADVK